MIWWIVILIAVVAVISWAAGGGLEPKGPPKEPKGTPDGVNPVNPMLTRDYGPSRWDQ